MKLTDDNILQANINRTKQYVRDYGGKVSTLPTATSSNVGQIYQYTGATTLTYTHGYFYECKENNGTYSWENVPVGEGSGDVSDSTTTITTSTATYPEYSAGETLKVIFGKIKKFLSDLYNKKADKVTSATDGNFAGLDSNGNLTDSGKKASDFASSGAGVPTGGTTGQVLKKKSGTNYDVEWAAESGDSSAYHTDDTAETTLADGDYFPFYDTSATGKRKTLWSNIKAKLKTYFDGLYSAKATSKGSATKGVYFDANGAAQEMSYTVGKSVPSNAVFTDTKNTAGSTDSSSKLFLIGATSQAANPQTYSQDTAYVGTDGNLYSGSKVVATQNMIGDAWVTSHAYAVGDYCIDGNVLYKCKTAHTSSASNRPPYASYWDAVSVASQLELNSPVTITKNTTDFPSLQCSVTGYQIGNLVGFTVQFLYSYISTQGWFSLGKVNQLPYILANNGTYNYGQTPRVPVVSGGNGAYIGMAFIDSDGTICFYNVAQDANNINFTISYRTLTN